MALNPKLLNDGEIIVVSTRTHAKALLVPVLTLVVLLAVGLALQLLVGHEVVTLVGWVLVAVLVARWSLWPFLEWLTGAYAFTDRRLITRTGVLVRRGHDIPLSRISDIEIELHLTDRLLGCGTLVISDASTHGRVVLPDIPRVEEIKRRVHQLLHDQATEATARHEGI
ncbi:PH domain-containing protein [Nocardioides sp. dk4132]|uniref:PH domain-containing protein n=1 Tax=unclassified Nocardioides TaxID=2615069 RepID=UPI001296EB90|nr:MULTISPECIES: PH domain-containing protein [unclassified Nocardioides]MQW75878.1 PH domain-containing protein [Nocardioides sp. dk4132]QGA08743.1 PH domain-containing protein [Nocardioides sp. dk884]